MLITEFQEIVKKIELSNGISLPELHLELQKALDAGYTTVEPEFMMSIDKIKEARIAGRKFHVQTEFPIRH